jgi:hypothetical protein
MNAYEASMLRRLSRLVIIIMLAVLAIDGARVVHKNTSQAISLRPLLLDASNPKRRSVGALTFLGAWELHSDNENFGGISALVALQDGRFLGVSDSGTLIGFGLSDNRAADRPFIAALPGAFAKNSTFKDRDSEGLAYDPQSGRIWVSYEAKHAIRRFPMSMARVDGYLPLKPTEEWEQNKGIEALARLRDGRFVALVEGLGDDTVPAMLFSGDPVEAGTTKLEFRYRPPVGYRPTDATPLPDGQLLVLNRSIGLPNGFSAKIGIFDPAAIKQGQIIAPKTIATLQSPLLVDNMEGMTTTVENGQIIVWIISDDNFNIFQRTVLMKFALNFAPNKKPEAQITPGFDSL